MGFSVDLLVTRHSGLLALLGLSKDQPIAMLASRMMCRLPSWVDYWPFANLHDAVASRETDRNSGIDKLDVRPLIAVMVNVVGSVAEQDAFRIKHTIMPSTEMAGTCG